MEMVDLQDSVQAAPKAASHVVANKVQFFDIPFQVPCGNKLKELTLTSETSWNDAQRAIGEKMMQHPSMLHIGYTCSWKSKSNHLLCHWKTRKTGGP